MFTGLIEGTGTLLRVDRRGADARMVIRADYSLGNLVLGESIAVDGACLTVASYHGSEFSVDVSAETLSRTTLGRKAVGCRLNLERALRVGDRIGGHLVSGHVDGIGVLSKRVKDGRSWRLFFDIPPELSRYTIPKGSIAVNGISLTINGCGEGHFDVNIVPHTVRMTTVGDLKTGDEVNIETDLIGKYVERLLAGWGEKNQQKRDESHIDLSFLQEHGFMR